MSDRILAFVDSFFLRTGGIKANSVISKFDICYSAADKIEKVTITEDTLQLKGFCQAVADATGGASNGDEELQVILKGSKILVPCAASLSSGQQLKLDITSGKQKAVAATAADIAAGKTLGSFLFYDSSDLRDAGTDGTMGVIQT